ncbi:hypothetical protein C8Q80DRAFT_1105465 [Daedaleopsis nitida]|nr:hypothetical protein C8Q80DRAFT_1105465 [Daedaleopsis nitida]
MFPSASFSLITSLLIGGAGYSGSVPASPASLSIGTFHHTGSTQSSPAKSPGFYGEVLLPIQPWTPIRQQQFESLIAQLTASVNFPLTWVENPVWLTFCDKFISAAKTPSRKVLTQHLLLKEVKSFRAKAISHTMGQIATVQGDGWTGINSHHLLAFVITAQCQAYTVSVLDVSKECKTANHFLKHIEDTFNTIKSKWHISVIAFTSNASGRSQKAQFLLLARHPDLVVLDCYAHQVIYSSVIIEGITGNTLARSI